MRRIVVGGLCIAAVMLLGNCASALALSGNMVTVGTAGTGTGGAQFPPVAVTVGAAGQAIIAWVDTSASPDTADYCVVQLGASSCTYLGKLTPTDGNTHIDGVQLNYQGDTLTLMADTFGQTDATAPTYQPVEEWQLIDGGATFNIVNSGQSVAAGDPSNDTQPIGAVSLPGTTPQIGFAFKTAAGAPTFHAFPVASPDACGRATTACADGYATLASATDSNQISNPANASFASVTNASTDGVLGIYETNSASGTYGCSNAATPPFGFAYVFGTGAQSPSNNYNVSPGQPNTAWRGSATEGDCNIDYPAVGGGPAGLGVLEDNLLTGQTQYHRFDTATGKFDQPPVVVSTGTEQQPAVSQDGAGGVYATYLAGGIGGPVSLAYSYDGGTTWSGPNTLTTDPVGKIAGLTNAVNPAGQGWSAWVENGTVYAQQFVAADSVPAASPTTLTAAMTAGTTTGTSITIPSNIGVTDQATLSGPNAAKATGSVTYALYSDRACTQRVHGVGVFVTNGQFAADSTSGLAPGTYYWTVTYSGNVGTTQGAVANAAASIPCGGQVLTVVPPKPPIVAHTAKSNGKTVALDATCPNIPCQFKATLTATTKPVKTSKSTLLVAANEKKAKPKPRRGKTITLGTGEFTLSQATETVHVKLSKSGKAFLEDHPGHVSVKLTLRVTVPGGKPETTTRTISITQAKAKPKKPKPKKHKG